jgi:hypothetical protein
MTPSFVAESALGHRLKGFAKPLIVVKRLTAVTMSAFRPARGAWIETEKSPVFSRQLAAFAPHAGSGLKPMALKICSRPPSFAPHAGRGLKRSELMMLVDVFCARAVLRW